MEWIKLERDKCGLLKGDVTTLYKYVPFMIREYIPHGDWFEENFYLVNEDIFLDWTNDLDTKPQYTHLLPNVPLIKD